MRVHRLFVLLTVLLALAGLALAQAESASVSGYVTDPSGRVIQGADVQITNVETGVSQVNHTNQAGLYLFPSLAPGRYRISVKNPGFKEFVKQGLTLHVQDAVSENFKMQIGSASESVTVSAEGAQANSVDATVGTVIDRNFVQNLPVNGRSFQTLIELSPGVVNTPVAQNGGQQGQFSVNGQRTDSNYFTVDGVAANFDTTVFEGIGQQVSGSLPATNIQGGFSNLVTMDDLQEFKIQTSTFAPEYGRQPGAQISLVTRSGSNQFHGSAFDYFRNDILDARDYFDYSYPNNPLSTTPLAKPPLRYNDFGGAFGGPVLLPGYNGRNKTFFFFSYEGQRFLLPQPNIEIVTPTKWFRDNASNPITKQLLSAFPLPNGANTLFDSNGNALGGLFTQSYSNVNNMDAWNLRIDQNFGQNYSFFFRYNRAPSYSNVANNENPAQFDHYIKNTQTLTVGATQVLSNRMVNEVRFNMSSLDGQDIEYNIPLDGATPPPDNLFLPDNYGGSQRRWTYYLYPFSDPVSGYPLGASGGPIARNQGRSLNFIDNLSVKLGSHQLKFGFDYRRNSPVSSPESLIMGTYFLSMPAVESATATFYLYDRLAGFTYLDANYSAYGQDTWRVNPRLSLRNLCTSCEAWRGSGFVGRRKRSCQRFPGAFRTACGFRYHWPTP